MEESNKKSVENKRKMPSDGVELIDRIMTLMDRFTPGRNSVERFAEMIGSHAPTIYAWKSYRSQPTKTALNKICKAFPEINPKWLLFGEPPMDNVVFTKEKRGRKSRAKDEILNIMLENNALRERIRTLEREIALLEDHLDTLKRMVKL